jgi:hypothetical protein
MKELEDRIAEVERTHGGRPQQEVLAALEKVVMDTGGQPHMEGLAERARRIAESGAGPAQG